MLVSQRQVVLLISRESLDSLPIFQNTQMVSFFRQKSLCEGRIIRVILFKIFAIPVNRPLVEHLEFMWNFLDCLKVERALSVLFIQCEVLAIIITCLIVGDLEKLLSIFSFQSFITDCVILIVVQHAWFFIRVRLRVAIAPRNTHVRSVGSILYIYHA